ncbi:TetR family transcriptional regulator C-terminal domain-containing protein [Streptomyces albidoflavus]|uniref:TetR/AcrR family transcriptional regulator n=1 Tax=Streptomyces albidoflavus TaxID=1886 RepID=UPI0033FDEC07
MSSRSTGAATSGRQAPDGGRADQIADAALTLLAERGLRGLTHRAVDEAAGLPQGSTSNHARTRLALLRTVVRRQAERESVLLAPPGGPGDTTAADTAEELTEALAHALHQYLTAHRPLLVARYELALEATRRPELREIYDEAGRGFREPLVALMRALGSPEPERHALSLVAWCDGLMFSCIAGSYHASVPSLEKLRRGFAELFTGMGLAGFATPGCGDKAR